MTKIAKAIGRSVEEWIGATPDTKPPKRVLVRIFDREHGICHISKRKIAPGEIWEAEHVVRLADGGENREGNLAPALVGPHRVKSAEERRAAVPVARRHETHIGASQPQSTIPSRKFSGPAPKNRSMTKRANGERRLYVNAEE